jgi:putative ABC transport system permease protein
LYLPPNDKRVLSQLVRLYPNITIINIADIMDRVRAVINKVTLAVEFIFFFTLLAGIVVLIAAVQASQDERRYEGAILRTLGATRRTLQLGLASEFIVLGSLAGLLAGISATAISWLLAEKVFHFPYQFNPEVIAIGLILGITIVTVTGLMGTRSVLAQPPLLTLRAN